MKTFFIILSFLFIVNASNAKNYYISSAGNDNNDGLTQTTPWKSITKLNASWPLINAGDNIYFRCGDVFYGSIIIGKSGTAASLITLSSYGTGAMPVISGFTALSGWSLVSPGIYKAAVKAKYNVNMVTLNDMPQRVGRYPNYNSTDGGFLTYTAFTGNTTLTANGLSTTNWTGGEVVARKEGYMLERDSITAQSAGTVTYTALPTINPRSHGSSTTAWVTNKTGYGLFVQRHIATLDQFGEWYFNKSTSQMNMFFGTNDPNQFKVNVSTIDTLINIGVRNFININGLSLEGANLAAIYFADAGNLTIRNNQIKFSGAKGIFGWNSSNVTVEGNSIQHSMAGAIDITGRYAKNCVVYKNTIKNTGTIPGMGSFFDDADCKAIYIGVDSIAVIRKNNIDTTGYVAIQYQGAGIMIDSNFINYFCFVKDDGGGIYTFGTNKTKRVIKNNIILNGMGAPFGNANPNHAEAIYCDGGSGGIEILNNTCAFISNRGVYLNSPKNIHVRGNTLFSSDGWGVNKNFDETVYDFSMTKNIFFSTNKTKNFGSYSNDGLNSSLIPVASTIEQALERVGIIDSNFYNILNPTGLSYQYQSANGWSFPKPLSFEGWKMASKHDNISKLTPVKFASYQVDALTTGDLLTSTGKFESSSLGITVWSPTTNITSGWDNSSKITGPGSLKITPAVSSTDYTFLYSSVGAISSSKQYILRVTTLGSAANGIMRAYLRQTASPRTSLTPAQVENFGTSKQVHEFLFTAPSNEAAASFLIEIQQSSGTTYVDNIEFYEAKATYLNVNDLIRFEYNATDAAKTVTLDAKYISVDSTVYNGTVVIQPYTSVVLIKSGAIASSLVADAGTDISLVLPTNTAFLKGSASGTVTSYNWTKIAGPTQFTIANPNNPSTTISNLTMGKYTFQLKVKNSAGDSAVATVNVVALGVLPVTLIDFTAINDSKKMVLQWKVTSEINLSHYSIERSGNGQSFENIGEVTANNLFTVDNYNFDDNFPLQGINYYRLAMVDKDGTTKYSKIISITANEVSSFRLNKLLLSANNNNLKIGIHSNYQQQLQVVLVDVSGRILYTNTIMLQKGFNTIDKKIAAVNTGIYYAKLFTNDQVITKTLLSEH